MTGLIIIGVCLVVLLAYLCKALDEITIEIRNAVAELRRFK